MSSLALLAERLSKHYGEGAERTDVLKGVDLRVARSEMVAVVGPSGAGKTTLLYLLGGLARPSSGTVTLSGASFSALGDAEISRLRNLKLGFVFQSHNPFPS
jgi:ABC-type lipoprotein export system ATPase subunit